MLDVSAADWRAWAEAHPAMKRQGSEWHGPCPACGMGEDRFRVSRRTGRAFCRQCCPDGRNAAAIRRLEEAAGLRQPGQGGRDWLADPPPRPLSPAPPADPTEAERKADSARAIWQAAGGGDSALARGQIPAAA